MTADFLRPKALPWSWRVVRVERADSEDGAPAWECEVSDGQTRLIVQAAGEATEAIELAARQAHALLHGPEYSG